MINVHADTTKFHRSLERARTQVLTWDRQLQAKVIEADMRTRVLPAGYEMHHLQPDWESRLWSLTHDLAVRMADRCQEGLMTPEEFGKLARNVAAWTVSEAIEATKPKTLTAEEIDRLLKGTQK